MREGEAEPFDVSIIRDTIKLTAVRTRLQGEAVVLRVTTFNDQTYSNLEEGLAEQIEAAGGMDSVEGIVLDLRNNPGGLLNQAIRVSDAFLEKGEIVSTRGRNPEDGDRYNATPGDLANGKPIVVLINGGSASASEIVAGALQDHRRAIVVGTKSFGKGSVQTIIPMGDKGALRLTTALYYTPSGSSIQGTGIEPDIKVEQPLPEELQGKVRTEGESSLPGHIKGQNENEEGSGSVAYVPPEAKDDVQLNHALDLRADRAALGLVECGGESALHVSSVL